MKFLVVSHIEVFRFGLRRIIELSNTDAEVIIDQSLKSITTAKEWEQFDMLILHISKNATDVSDFLEVHQYFRKNIKVLIISDDTGLLEAKFLFTLGVKGYTDSKSTSQTMEKAIETVLSGSLYADASLLIQSFDNHFKNGKSTVGSIFQLTIKELEIATYLIQGMSNNEISHLTNRKPSTISTQKTRILSKMQVRNVVELMKIM